MIGGPAPALAAPATVGVVFDRLAADAGIAGAGNADVETAMAGCAATGSGAATDRAASGLAGCGFALLAPKTVAVCGDTAFPPTPGPTFQEIPRLWQVSHGAVVFGWSFGLVLTPGYIPPWQLAQSAVIPAWFIVHEANVMVLL
jgi:hypothetical protein